MGLHIANLVERS